MTQPTAKPSYLGSMTSDERAMAIALSLLAHGVTAHEIHAGGYVHFLRVSRPPLRDWGVTNQDLETVWGLITVAHHFPGRFRRLAKAM